MRTLEIATIVASCLLTAGFALSDVKEKQENVSTLLPWLPAAPSPPSVQDGIQMMHGNRLATEERPGLVPPRGRDYFEYSVNPRMDWILILGQCEADTLNISGDVDEWSTSETPISLALDFEDFVNGCGFASASTVVETTAYGAPDYMVSVNVNAACDSFQSWPCNPFINCYSAPTVASGSTSKFIPSAAYATGSLSLELLQPLPDGVYFVPLEVFYGLHASYSGTGEWDVKFGSNEPGLSVEVNAGGMYFSRGLDPWPTPGELAGTSTLWVPFPKEEMWVEFALTASLSLRARCGEIFPSSYTGQAIATVNFSLPEAEPGLLGNIDWNDYIAIVYPDSAYKQGDVNHDSEVNVVDLLLVIESWGPCKDNPPDEYCDPDVNHDLVVGVDDLLIVIGDWGWELPPDFP